MISEGVGLLREMAGKLILTALAREMIRYQSILNKILYKTERITLYFACCVCASCLPRLRELYKMVEETIGWPAVGHELKGYRVSNGGFKLPSTTTLWM